MTIDDMRERLRMLLTTTTQQDSATDALARRVNRCLLVFGDRLYDLDSGKDQPIVNNERHDASAIAAAAAQLTGTTNADSECILLLLPPAEFLADSVNLPGLSPAAMRAALSLRAMTELPEFDQPLDLALTVSRGSDALAWWIPTARTNSLFAAFAGHSLFLAAVLPRPAWFISATAQSDNVPDIILADIDGNRHTVTARVTAENAPRLSCFQTLAEDLADPELATQWQAQLAHAGIKHIEHTVSSGEDFLRLQHQYKLPPIEFKSVASAVFPGPALAARHSLNKGRRRRQLLSAIAAGFVLISLPFVYQSWQLVRLENQLTDIRLLSAEARQHQADVRDFETRWGVFTEFPQQDVGATMLELQTVINPGVLSLFEIDEGLISIEGESQDPQNLLEQLEQNPMFTEVDFARATNNNRYFIDLRLSTVNFPAYQQWHFPESR